MRNSQAITLQQAWERWALGGRGHAGGPRVAEEASDSCADRERPTSTTGEGVGAWGCPS